MASLFPALRFGGDYNPEQWPREVWDEDVALMRGAGVTTATVGVFSWALLEPRDGEFDFEWLDDILDRLHEGGIRVILATATASPPAWLVRAHPEMLPVDVDGITLGFGSRQSYSPSSAAYREHAVRLVERIAERYGAHPALEAWHINNEYGCHVARSYDAESADAFRAWLEKRYGTIEELNRAWGTAFWSQHYGRFDEIDVPRTMPTFGNPTQLLDFERFSSDALLGLYLAELEVLRRVTPDVPITTNFMGFFAEVDYWKWAQHVDFVTDDSYPDPADPDSYVLAAATRDLMRSLRGGQPWLLMEQAPSAVNWRADNSAKAPGAHRAHSLQAIGRGSDGVLHFQWRQSQAGAEKFHSAMVPHAGPDSRVHREIQALGAELAGMQGVIGEEVSASVGIVFSWDSLWANRQHATPSSIDYLEHVLDWYRPFLDRGVATDFVGVDSDLSTYRILVVASLVSAPDEFLDRLEAWVAAGGTLVVGHQSGILDQDLHARLGGYLGALRGALGVRVEEFAPAGGRNVPLTGELDGHGQGWQEFVLVDSAEVVARFGDGLATGHPALTRRDHGDGVGWYLATRPDAELAARLVSRVLEETGVEALIETPTPGVEAVERGAIRFVINHGDIPRTVLVAGEELTLDAHGASLRPRR
ncbi:MAG: beta-galactosidase [Naasia sp.]